MHTYSKRWEEAQEIEKFYWSKEYFRESEFKELALKYARVFEDLEHKYNFKPDTKILDLGCGSTCPSILFENGVKYGVDPLVEIFLENDKKKLSGKIELKRGSGEEIPFESGFFDVSLCRNALDHMDNVEKVMQEIGRVTKDKGLIVLSIYTYTPFIAFLKRATEFIPFLKNVEHPFTFTPIEFREFCGNHFDIVDEKTVFEGKSSIDYGKQDVEMKEPLLNKVFAWANRYVFMNDWFLREHMVVCRKR